MSSKFVNDFSRGALMLLLVLNPAWSATAAAPQTYQVKSGETIDHVIQQTMGQSPLRIELLRQALIQQNPQAFSKGSHKVLLAGSTLVIPNHDELLRQYIKPNAAPAATSGSERKNWIRYP